MPGNNPLDLLITRVIKAPRDLVWKAWSTPEHLQQWWCPKPWTTEVLAFDLRPGGSFHTFMRGPDGGTSDNPGCFIEVVPMQRLVCTSALIENFRPADQPWIAITTIFSFADTQGGTLYTARVMHSSEEAAKHHLELGFHEGWNVMTDQMEAYAQTLA